MSALAYRLRIRDAADTTNLLVVSSVRGGTNPYITEAPSGDGQEIDPLSGATRTGLYTVRVADPITSGTTRVITSVLFNSAGQQKLIGLLAYVEISTDNGSTWNAWLGGYVMNYRLSSAITWEFQVGDTRRIENNLTVFDGTSTTFVNRGTLFGGPIIGGFGPAGLGVPSRPGWTFKYLGVFTNGGGTSFGSLQVAIFQFVDGYLGALDPTTTRLRDALGGQPNVQAPVNATAAQFRAPGQFVCDWQGLRYYFPARAPGTQFFIPCATPREFGGADFFDSRFDPTLPLIDETSGCIAMYWDGTSLPSVGDQFYVHCYGLAVSDTSPIYFDMHPVDVATALYDDAGIVYDSGTATTVRAQLGDDFRVAFRITKSENLLSFLQTKLFGPFGFGVRVSDSGVLEFFVTRVKNAAAPSVTLTTNDLRNGTDVIFENDEKSIITTVRMKCEQYQVYSTLAPNASERPLDGIVVNTNETIVTCTDASAAGTKQEQAYDVPGMLHLADSFSPVDVNYATALGQEIFNRYSHGAPSGTVAVLRGSDPGVQIGDQLYLAVAHLPNLNKRYGDDPSVGARVMQVLRRTQAPEGPSLFLLDAGLGQQPTTPAATISIAANVVNPRLFAQFTITNAAAINAAAVLIVAVEWATGASAPSGNGMDFVRYPATACPTGAVPLPAVGAGRKVWVRARTEQAGRLSSAWTAWTSVTLTAVDVVSALGTSLVRQNAVTVSWTLGNVYDAVNVYLYPGSSAPADWSPYLVASLNAGSTSCVLRGLLGPSQAYIIGVAQRDMGSGQIGPMVTTTFSTNSASDTAPDPLSAVVIAPTVNDAALPTGIMLGLFPADPVFDFVVERAPDSSGVPGSYAVVATCRGATQVFYDVLPADGATYWYRVAHVLPGYAASGYTAAVSGTPRAMPNNTIRPSTGPTLSVSTVLGSTSYDIVWNGTGVVLVSIDGATPATPMPSPITVARDVTGGVTHTYAFTATLNAQTVPGLAVIPPQDASPSAPVIYSLSAYNVDTPCDGGGSVDIAFVTANMPVGATFDLDYNITTGAFSPPETGTVTNITNPYTLSVALCPGAGGDLTLTARDSMGTIIATYSVSTLFAA